MRVFWLIIGMVFLADPRIGSAAAVAGAPAPVVASPPVLPSPVPLPPLLTVALFATPDPAALSVAILSASTQDLLASVGAALIQEPGQLTAQIGQISAPAQQRLVQALFASAPGVQRLAQALLDVISQPPPSLSLDGVEARDLDVVAAMATFAAQDTRYQDIYPYSAFGQELAAVQQNIANQGMTQGNKTALIQVYKDATAALQEFLHSQSPQ